MDLKKHLIGTDHAAPEKELVSWVRNTFKEDQYKLTYEGFIYNDYYLTFNDERSNALFLIRWGDLLYGT